MGYIRLRSGYLGTDGAKQEEPAANAAGWIRRVVERVPGREDQAARGSFAGVGASMVP